MYIASLAALLTALSFPGVHFISVCLPEQAAQSGRLRSVLNKINVNKREENKQVEAAWLCGGIYTHTSATLMNDLMKDKTVSFVTYYFIARIAVSGKATDVYV